MWHGVGQDPTGTWCDTVLDRIQRGHDVTLVGDMGPLRVEYGRIVETHGVVQLRLRVGTDPSRCCYTCRWHGTTARWRRQNSGNPWGSTTELESWYGPFTSMAWDGGRRDERASHKANVLILWWWIIAYLMPLVGTSSSMVGPTIAGSSRECSKRHMPAYYEAISYILAIHSKHGNAVMGWQPRSNKFLVCVDDVLTQTLCYSHSCLTWKFVEVRLPGSRCSAANRTFSASVSGLNVAEDGGICRMNVGIWGSGVQVPPDVNEQYSIVQGSSPSSRFKPRVQVLQFQSNQGFESLKSIQAKGSSPSSPV